MDYQKKGYLTSYFRFFHLKDSKKEDFTAHYHDFDKIILFLSGEVEYVIEGQNYPLRPFDMLFIKRNTIHYPKVSTHTPYHRIVIYMDPNYLLTHQDGDEDLRFCFKYASKNKKYVMHLDENLNKNILDQYKILEESITKEDYAQNLYARLSLLSLLVLINRSIYNKNIDFDKKFTFDSQIMEVLNYINNNLLDDLSIDTLANKFFISKFYLMRKFRQNTGYTIHQYILNKRLILAKDKIKEGIALTEVCFLCGFKDYSVFSRKFKMVYHKTPRDFKKEQIYLSKLNYHMGSDDFE